MSEAVLEALLRAHVEFERARFRGPALEALVVDHAQSILRWFAAVELDDVIDHERIMGVIDRYVITFKVSGGITELVGEIARLVFSSRALDHVTVAQMVPLAAYEEFAEKAVALEGVRREIVSLVAHSATVSSATAEMLARTMTDFVFQPASAQSSTLIPGLAELRARIGARFVPGFERTLAEFIAHYIDSHRVAIARAVERHILAVLDAERLRSITDELWDALSPLPLVQVFAFLGEQDLDDIIVLSHEFWLKFREVPYFREVLSDSVAYFFRKYGRESLLAIIEDMGVSEAMIRHELITLLVPVLEHANETGFLGEQLHAHFASFYRSPEAAAVLAGALERDRER